MPPKNTPRRAPVAKKMQVRVFRRDKWLCEYCGVPVVFPPAMRLLQVWLRARLKPGEAPPAYWSYAWRRDLSPLLDQLGVVVDHCVPHIRGGGTDEDNLVTACNKCNTRKSFLPEHEHRSRHPRHRIRSKYGEPTGWDGFSAVFLALAAENPDELTASERAWRAALESVE